MHNLGTVFRFEIVRTLKKKSFWILALLFPLAIVVIGAIIHFSNQATDQASKDNKNQKFSYIIKDDSKLLKPSVYEQGKNKVIADKNAGIKQVTDGKVDAFFYYPKNIQKDGVQIYAKDVGLFDNGRYEGLAKGLLQASVIDKVSVNVASVLQGNTSVDSTLYKDGKKYDGFQHLIAPGIFLVLFYILITMFGNQMLTSTTEEKENRVIEMILTTIEARTLIIGKILSLVVLGLLQVVIILVPIAIIYGLFHNAIDLPTLDLSHIPLDWGRIAIGAVIFLVSFLLFTGILVAIGAAVPTAKEAGGFFGVVMILIFGPLYAATLYVSNPDALIVKILSFFPLTAPIPLLLRNAIGNLSYGDAAIAIVILMITTVFVMMIAVRMFRYGALEYSKRISLKTLFGR